MKLLRYILFIFPLLFISCEEEEDYGFPSKIEIPANGGTIEIKGSNDIAPSISQLELLNYNGDGNSSESIVEGQGCIKATTDWLTVKYLSAEYTLVITAEPNETNKKRKLYLYLYDAPTRQEITITQSK